MLYNFIQLLGNNIFIKYVRIVKIQVAVRTRKGYFIEGASFDKSMFRVSTFSISNILDLPCPFYAILKNKKTVKA